MGLLVYWILVGSPCSFAWTNLPLRKSHWASITTLFMTSRVHVSPGTPRNDSVLKSLRSLSDFFHSAVALSSSLTPSASDFQTPVAKPATAMQPPSAGWSSGGVSFPVGGQTDRHERMSLGRWGCGAGVAGRVRRLEIRTAVAGALVLAGARSSLATRLHVAQQRRGATLSLTGTTCGLTVHCGTVGFLPLTGTTWMCVRPHRE